jgi:methyl-accepting chemotaxis protein/cytochrome b561
VTDVAKTSSNGKYSPLLQSIHWVVTLFVICQLTIVLVLGQLRSLQYGQYVLGLHRQLGFAILLACIVRVAVLAGHRAPSLRNELPAWQILAGRLVHLALYATMVIQPVLGICIAWARGDTVTAFGIVTLPAPWEISDAARDRLMTAHIVTAAVLVGLVTIHVGAVVFNGSKRRLAVMDRMLPSAPADTFVNRVPVTLQLLAALGIVIAIALATGVNAITKYREFTHMTVTYQENDLAAADETRAAQVAWKEIVGIGSAGNSSGSDARVRTIADTARTHLASAAEHAADPAAREAIDAVSALIQALGTQQGPFAASAIADVDARVQDLIDAQAATGQQIQGDITERASRGHDLIVITVAPMTILGLIIALMLARSMSSSVARMRTLIRGIETDEGSENIVVRGRGEFAVLMREMVGMRSTIQQRSQIAADQRLALEGERGQLAQDQQAKQREAERLQSVERQGLRDQLAKDFESQVAGIVESVAATVQALRLTSDELALSAASTTQRSADASVVAETTKNAASRIAASSKQLSEASRSVRKHAEESKERAVLGVQEASAARAEIDLLAVASGRISSVTETIANVTRQTQLLSINARIEAARAGEAGRGFCIVAEEVKTLAAKTQGATKSIGDHVQQVGTAAARSIEILKNMRSIISDLEQGSSNIFAACDDQTKSTEDIASKVTEISSSTIAVAENIVRAEQTARATEAMAADVVKTANLLQNQADSLQDQVANFVLQLRSVGSRGQPQDYSSTNLSAAKPLSAVA